MGQVVRVCVTYCLDVIAGVLRCKSCFGPMSPYRDGDDDSRPLPDVGLAERACFELM